MPKPAVDSSDRMNLRVRPEVKARLMRAAALRQTNLTDFVTQAAAREADAVIEQAHRIHVSERDAMRILDLLDNPPPPNERLRAAAAAFVRNRR
jgi:uncharacterized protein (DUF1778 family)